MSLHCSKVLHLERSYAADQHTHLLSCYCCQVIGVVVADTEPLARRAAKMVVVEYEDLPAILSCEDAIAANSFYGGYDSKIIDGDVDACFASGACDHVIEGECVPQHTIVCIHKHTNIQVPLQQLQPLID